MSKAYTKAEVKALFQSHVRDLVKYWTNVRMEPALLAMADGSEVRARLEGLAFSIMTTLDGDAADLPKFAVIPDPHPDDKKFHMKEGSDYFPPFRTRAPICDIAGALHETLFLRREEKGPGNHG